MSCDDVTRWLAEESGPPPAALLAHAGGCAACARLLGGPDQLLEEPAPKREEFDRLRAALAEEAKPIQRARSLPTRLRGLAVLLVVGAGVAAGAAKLRPDFAFLPTWRMVLELSLFSAFVAFSSWIWLRPSYYRGLPGWLPFLALLTGLAAPVVLAALPAAHVVHPASLEGAGADLFARALRCFGFGTVLALPTVLAGVVLGRSDRFRLPLALMPVAAGAWTGLFALYWHCPITQPVHLLVGHATLVAILVGLYSGGAWVLSRFRRSGAIS